MSTKAAAEKDAPAAPEQKDGPLLDLAKQDVKKFVAKFVTNPDDVPF